MNRRSGPGSFRPADFSGRRQGGAGRAILLTGIGVAVLVAAMFFVLRVCNSSACTDVYCPSSETFAETEGFERLSAVFELDPERASTATDLEITVDLDESTADNRNISFFRYVPETRIWELLAPAALVDDGSRAVATIATPPQYLAVLRRVSAAGHVIASVNHNQALHATAAETATIVQPRDFKPDSAGGLTGEMSDRAALGLPAESSALVYPSITASSADPGMIPILTSILASAGSRSNHVGQIVAMVAARQAAGVNIAYADLPVSERTSFGLFINELGAALRGQGKALTVTIPAPLLSGERVDEGAYDWAEIGRAADVVIMAPYRDQSTFRRDMPAILQHLATVVAPEKIAFMVTPYATEKSPEGIRVLTLTQAMGIATALSLNSDGGLVTGSTVNVEAVNINRAADRSGIAWQPQTASVAFTYEQSGGRTVWLENFYSIGFKLELIPRYSLGGVAIEDASGDVLLGDIWSALEPFITTGQPILAQPNPEDLVPVWAVSAGTAEGGQNGVMRWGTPSQPGTHTITLTLTDGFSIFENQISVEVQARTQPGTATPAAGN